MIYTIRGRSFGMNAYRKVKSFTEFLRTLFLFWRMGYRQIEWNVEWSVE